MAESQKGRMAAWGKGKKAEEPKRRKRKGKKVESRKEERQKCREAKKFRGRGGHTGAEWQKGRIAGR